MDEEGALKVSKGTFMNKLDLDKFNDKRKETITTIIERLAEVFNTQIFMKVRRISMSIPTKRTFSADSKF